MVKSIKEIQKMTAVDTTDAADKSVRIEKDSFDFEVANIYTKMIIVQQALDAIKKDGDNPHFKSSYVTLPEMLAGIKKPLNDAGLLLVQKVKGTKVISRIYDFTGEYLESMADISILGGIQTIHQYCGAITYLRRYTLSALLALEEVDDDGESALPKSVAPQVQPQKPHAASTQPLTAEEKKKRTLTYMTNANDLTTLLKTQGYINGDIDLQEMFDKRYSELGGS